ncbi:MULTISPECIES: SHIRT domain-containing protein [unclassified Breznakia]|uniref:SHIRT domain-containing protein n=1 Tax=unclassified Breznakia TaxID=2623764 RepID=UPI002406EDDB|nr:MULTISPECIES: SHIRT domain-containing protein [unclassified Breznakia]
MKRKKNYFVKRMQLIIIMMSILLIVTQGLSVYINAQDSIPQNEVVTETGNEEVTETNIEEETKEVVKEGHEKVDVEEIKLPTQMRSAMNRVYLSSSNVVLKDPSSFSVGTLQTRTFTVLYQVTPMSLAEGGVNRHLVFTVPKHFSLTADDATITKMLEELKMKNIKITTTAEGVQQIDMDLPNEDINMFAVSFEVQQDALGILKDMSEDKVYRFGLQNYCNYIDDTNRGTLYDEGEDGYTNYMDFTVNKKEANYSINSIETKQLTPKELGAVFGGRVDGKALSANEETIAAANNMFMIDIEKTAGYFTTDMKIEIPLPNCFIEPINITAVFKDKLGNEVNLGRTISGNTITLNPYANIHSAMDYVTAADNASWMDFLEREGTITIKVGVKSKYHSIEENTLYEASDVVSMDYMLFDTSQSIKSLTGDKVSFMLKNGDLYWQEGENLHSREAYIGNTLQTKLEQYKSKEVGYNTKDLSFGMVFDVGKETSWRIEEDFKVTYTFKEELSPIALTGLKTTKDQGFIYQFYKDNESTPFKVMNIGDGDTYDASSELGRGYISKIEIIPVNNKFSWTTAITTGGRIVWFDATMKTYDKFPSTGADIPDGYEAKIVRELDSKDLQSKGGAITKDIVIKLTEKKDDLQLFGVGDASYASAFLNGSGTVEVNNHKDSVRFISYGIRKRASTMDYNIDAEGNTYPSTSPEFNPVTVTISGDAVAMIDRVGTSRQQLVSYVDENGVEHKVLNDAEAYREKVAASYFRYPSEGDTQPGIVVSNLSGQNGNVLEESELYKLDEIIAANGGTYATSITVALYDVNTWEITDNSSVVCVQGLYAKTIKPGHMGYDAVIGDKNSDGEINGKDLGSGISLSYSVSMDCNRDDLAHEYHPASVVGTSRKIILGSYPKTLSVSELDWYVAPNAVATGLSNVGTRTAKDHILGVVEPKSPSGEQMHYQNVIYDFSDTNEEILALTNAIYIDERSYLNIEFTYYESSSGEYVTKSFEDIGALRSCTSGYWLSESSGWYEPTAWDTRYSDSHTKPFTLSSLVPEFNVLDGDYITALKVSVPNDVNWGSNGSKYDVNNATTWQRESQFASKLPKVALARANAALPKTYPISKVEIGQFDGSTSDLSGDNKDGTGVNYDQLKVAVALSFDDIYGSKYELNANGRSSKIARPVMYVNSFNEAISYKGSASTTSTYQGNTLTVTSTQKYNFTDETKDIDSELKIRPTIYYKIHKDFTYVKDSIGGLPEGATVVYLPPGTGELSSGSIEYGYLIVDYSGCLEGIERNTNFTKTFDLYVSPNAEAIHTAKPVLESWMDSAYDSNRDGSYYDFEKDYDVETGDSIESKDTTKTGAPFGEEFFNETTGKNRMLHADVTTTHSIQMRLRTGINGSVLAKAPYDQGTAVSSKAITTVDNLFSMKANIFGDITSGSNEIYNYSVYIPIPKKGNTYTYFEGLDEKESAADDFSMNAIGYDFSSMDSATGDVEYTLYYSTSTTPSMNNLNSGLEDPTGEYKEWNAATTLEELEAATMIKVIVKNIKPFEAYDFEIKCALSEDKSVVGEQTSSTIYYSNIQRQANNDWLSNVGYHTSLMTYTLTDMELYGHAWYDEIENALYDRILELPKAGIELKVYKDGVEIDNQPDSSITTTNSDGEYRFAVPSDGKYTVKVVSSPITLVEAFADGDDGANSSWYNPDTKLAEIEVVADFSKDYYTSKDILLGIKKTYKATHSFKSGTEGLDLPTAIDDYLPEDITNLVNTASVSPTLPTTTTYADSINDGVWTFKNYDAATKTINNADVNFEGTWEFEANKYKATYSFKSGTEGVALPTAINDYLPSVVTNLVNKTSVTPTLPTTTTYVDSINDGVWTFKRYDALIKTINKADINFEGIWEFEANKYKATHSFKSGTEGVALPTAIDSYLPKDITNLVNKEAVTPTLPTTTTYADSVNDGVWTFKGYDVTTTTINKADVNFEGTWEFKINRYKAVHIFESGTSGVALPTAIDSYLPEDITDLINKESVSATLPSTTTYVDSVNDGVWTFKGYDENTKTINKANVKFKGVWEFEANKYKAVHTFESGTDGLSLPTAIDSYLPEDIMNLVNKESVSATLPSTTTYVDSVNDGVWTFKGYDENTKTINKADEKFKGVWKFEKNKQSSPSKDKRKPSKMTATYSPSTGDESNIEKLIIMLGVSMLGIFVVGRKRKA